MIAKQAFLNLLHEEMQPIITIPVILKLTWTPLLKQNIIRDNATPQHSY